MSEETTARLKVTEEDGITIVELQDRKILDEINIMQIGEQLFQIVAGSDNLKLVLDFWQVAHMSSAALGVLITLHKRVRERSGQLCLCSIQPAIQEIFQITRLNEIFSICGTRNEAVKSLS